MMQTTELDSAGYPVGMRGGRFGDLAREMQGAASAAVAAKAAISAKYERQQLVRGMYQVTIYKRNVVFLHEVISAFTKHARQRLKAVDLQIFVKPGDIAGFLDGAAVVYADTAHEVVICNVIGGE